VDFYFPKFKIEWEHSLKHSLIELGFQRSFSNQAEFFQMTSNPVGLKIGEVFHKAMVEVTETGTEAAAATVVKMKARAMVVVRHEAVAMRVDRPFIFIIRDESKNLPLFIGNIVSV